MSVDVYLKLDGETAEVAAHTEGGTYAVGGSAEAHLNITYNYGKILALAVPDYPGMIEFFDKRSAADMIPVLEALVEKLGTNQHEDYWAPTPGNTGHALSIILKWCKQHPTATLEAHG